MAPFTASLLRVDGPEALLQRARQLAKRDGLAAARTVAHAFGALSSDRRALPDFLIVGTLRGGTTTLYHALVRHPQVAGAVLDKEVHYFDLNVLRGEAWYRARFPTRASLERRAHRSGGAIKVGEATPYYLFHPAVPERVAASLRGVRVIAMLRDPVERAWSHYRHEVDLGYESLAFGDALDAEDRRLAGEEERLRSDPRYVSFAHQHHSYVARGRYAAQLRRWFDALGSHGVLVIRSEDLYAAPQATFARVLEHIGVRPWDPGDWRVRNAATSRGLDDEVRARLRGAFRDDRADLATLLGGDPGWPT
jgi:hypothetical protein